MKVVIIGGSGGVGSSAAFNLLALGLGLEVVIVDRSPAMVTSHVMDLEQVLHLTGGGQIRGGGVEEAADADVVVVTAAVPLRLNTSRAVFLNDNASIVRSVFDAVPPDWGGVVLMVTNPVDPLCTWLHRNVTMERGRLLGYTLNDSLRLRTGIADALRTDPHAVSAWVLGEHGDGCFPLWGRVHVDGKPVRLTTDQSATAESFLRSWYVRHVALDSGRTSTWTSGLGIAQMVGAIATDAQSLWPASVLLEGEYGLHGTSLSVPVTLGRGGATTIHEWPLEPSEQAALCEAAEVISEQADAIRLDG